MDTVNNLVSAASKAIWGEQTTTENNETTGQEPVSGQTGNVEGGEPYDMGNAGSSALIFSHVTHSITSISQCQSNSLIHIHLSPTQNIKTNTNMQRWYSHEACIDPTSHTNTDRNQDFEESRNTSTAKPTSDPIGNVSTNTAGAPPTRPEDSKTDAHPSSGDTTGPGAAPSVDADPSSAPQNTQKQQGADRPGEEPGSSEHEGIKEAKKETEDAQKVDTSAAGPVPLVQKAKEGVTAGAGASGGDDDGPQKESHGEGTGQKYVRSTGLKAEGGDFDAAKPGAAKEADRKPYTMLVRVLEKWTLTLMLLGLLEQQGIHREASGSGSKDESSTGGNGGTEGKRKLKEKIKEKLHRN